jgi:hypothetical protein
MIDLYWKTLIKVYLFKKYFTLDQALCDLLANSNDLLANSNDLLANKNDLLANKSFKENK